MVKYPRVTAKDLQDLVVASTELSVSILRCLLSNKGLCAQTPRHAPLLTHTSTRLAISNMLKTIKVSHKCFGILFYGAEKQNWNFSDQWISGGGRVKHTLKRTLSSMNVAWGWLGDAPGLLCFLWPWNLQHVEGKMDSIKDHETLGGKVICDKAKTGCH